MNSEEKTALDALAYIIPVFERLKLRWCIAGGFACYVYGVPRHITDIDIDIDTSVNDPVFQSLLKIVAPTITSPLEHYVDQNYDCHGIELLDILDICPMRELSIYSKESDRYENFYKSGFPNIEFRSFQQLSLPLLSRALIIKNKEMLVLQRDTDFRDIAGLKNLGA
jgi:hypothetical protein